MDVFTFMIFLGAAGLAAMALQGFGGGHGSGHGHGHGHAGHGHGGGNGGHGGHGHGGHGHAGHAGHAAHGHAGQAHSGHAGVGHAGSGHHGGHGVSHGIGAALLSFASPRTLFSICLGAGAVGPLLRHFLGGGALTIAAAIMVGVIFDRLIVTPIWNFSFRFASAPALTLESCVEDEGTAVTSFDRNGHGIIAVDLDGQVVQLLATLSADDRALGAAVRAGDRVRIADVDTARNRCTVAVL